MTNGFLGVGGGGVAFYPVFLTCIPSLEDIKLVPNLATRTCSEIVAYPDGF